MLVGAFAPGNRECPDALGPANVSRGFPRAEA
jgi:hypothetical protein